MPLPARMRLVGAISLSAVIGGPHPHHIFAVCPSAFRTASVLRQRSCLNLVPSSFPERDNAPTDDNEHAAREYRPTGNRPEGDKIDNLPDDEQCRDV
jgi:hypothetical protein